MELDAVASLHASPIDVLTVAPKAVSAPGLMNVNPFYESDVEQLKEALIGYWTSLGINLDEFENSLEVAAFWEWLLLK